MDSLKVAEAFAVQHESVLQAIENLECSEQFKALNFQQTPDGGYMLTEAGVLRLVFDFNGPNAAVAKEKILATFQAMKVAVDFVAYAQELERLAGQVGSPQSCVIFKEH